VTSAPLGPARRVYFVGLNNVPFLPLVAGLMRAYAEQDPELRSSFSFVDPIFLADAPEQIAEAVVEPDILALSCYVWNFRRQMKIARLVKARHPETLVVAGGPHVPDRPMGFFAEFPCVDLLVHGEGEIAFSEILRQRLRADPDYTSVPGVSMRSGSAVVSGAPPARLPRAIQTPSPYLLGHLDAAVHACRERGLRFYALWETNRGCPYSCAFCDWGSATMSSLRTFDDERLAAEIEWFGRYDVEDIFICDANFGILARDLEIARAFADVRAQHGAPRQIRVNFAKNSNERVLEISRLWHRADLLMGTTLSLQSTDLEVLEAIDRKNIGIDNYRRLERRYHSEGIPTYTELILGLPLETRSSFRRGIGKLLAAGSHEDLRVYDFAILPNAPINRPSTLDRYGIVTMPKQIYHEAAGTPPDEIETVDMVCRTDSMRRADLVDCWMFVVLLQALHNGVYTRYLAQHLNRSEGIDYETFYTGLQCYAAGRPRSVLGGLLNRLWALYDMYYSSPDTPLANLVASQPDLATELEPFGVRRGWTTDHWAWLRISTHFTEFYSEVAGYLRSLGLPIDRSRHHPLAEIWRYQQDVMVRPEYDPSIGKISAYGYDLPAYFAGEPLQARSVRVRYTDRALGADNRDPLVRGNLKAYARAAVGPSYPISRIRRYQHQPDATLIERLSGGLVATGDRPSGRKKEERADVG
jgi:putative methyltransferase